MTDTWRTASTVLSTLVIALVLSLPVPGPWTTLLAALAAGVLGSGARGVRWLSLAVVLGGLGTAMVSVTGIAPWAEGAREMVFALAWVGLPWLSGLAWRLRSQVREQAAEQRRQLARQREYQERQDRDAERIALAGAIHDDLGHALSLVALNLGRLELDDSLPAAAHQTVEAARHQLTGAVERLSASVQQLRTGQVPGLAHQADADLAVLVGEFRSAGASIALDWDTDTRPVPAQVVQVVREALTNATKHAPGAPVTIRVQSLPDQTTRLRVTNPASDAAALPGLGAGAGSGLAALGERLSATGSVLRAGAHEGEFRVEAIILPPDDSGSEDSDQLPVISARRRILLIGAGLATCVVVVLGGLEVFAQSEARRALLPAEDYARLVPGMPRDQARMLLPANELLPAPDSPVGQDCHDYSVSTDWFADTQGDVYRVCFAGARLASTALVVD